jgi:malonate decarboxylase alpha subunit
MKNWDTQKTSLAERLADGRRYASGKTAEAVDLSNFLQAVIRSGDRVCMEGDNQKQADVLAPLRSPTSIPPRSMIFT